MEDNGRTGNMKASRPIIGREQQCQYRVLNQEQESRVAVSQNQQEYRCRNTLPHICVVRKRLRGSYTVEAAGVMAVVFFTMLVLFHQAFYMGAWTAGTFQVHQQVERERHQIVHKDERSITRGKQGQSWQADITARVFRPEESLRMWSILEENGEH